MKELLKMKIRGKRTVKNNEYHFKQFENLFNIKQDEFNDLVNDIFECNYYHLEEEFGALHTHLIEIIKCLDFFLTWTMTNDLYYSSLNLKRRYLHLKNQVIKYINYQGK